MHFDERQVASGYPIIRRGAKGVYVCVAQDALIFLGYDTGGLDGIFGAKTDRAVRDYQNRNGLVIDGIIGPATWNLLMKEVVGKNVNNNDY